MIKNFTPYLYQETIFSTCTQKNTLVVLPTGMGKTNIFLMLAAHRLKLYPNSKILLIGPTRPLIEQYLRVFEQHFEMPSEKMAVFTGMVAPSKREELWKKAQIFFSTPQGLENDIITDRIKLEEVSLLGIDEAHRAVGDYAYVFVARQYHKRAEFPRLIGMTASPGSDMEKIQEVCRNLFIEEVEVRTDEDPDVKAHIQPIDTTWIKVMLPKPFLEVQKFITAFLKDRMEKLKKWGVLRRTDLRYVNKKDLLLLQAQLRARASSGEKDFTLWNAISVLAEIMKMQHALELLETQGVTPLHTYLGKLQQEAAAGKSKAVKNVVSDLNYRSALIKVQAMMDEKMEHPKMIELQRLIEKEAAEKSDIKIMVFNQYRDNAAEIVAKLNALPGVKAQLFVGQLKKGETGLSQKMQKATIEDFREGKFNVLVSTSIGEEGLDVPRVDLVVFYEPIPSAIRHIQRRGRTGRQEKGRVIILMAKDTRDEGYKWSAQHKEKRMYRNLAQLRGKLGIEMRPKDKPLENFLVEEEKLKIFADHREKNSGTIQALVDMGFRLKLEQLETADYVLSSRVGVEIKTVGDFVNSIIDGRLLEQLKELKRNFERPIVVLEGQEDIYSVRNVHPNAIRGMLATIAVDFNVPIIQTKTPKETAALLAVIAKREQTESADFSLHGSKKPMTTKELQEYIVSAFPGVGAVLSKPLLKTFKSVKGIVNASAADLEKVEKIGPKKAQAIKDVVEKEYED